MAHSVTVVVCTRNRADALRRCLASVADAKARCPQVSVEVIVVDNGSSDDTHDVVRSAPLPVRLVEEHHVGLAAARNAGVKNATGTLIAFTDDDCCVGPNYFYDMLRHFLPDDVPVIRTGRVELGDKTDDPRGSTKIDTIKIRYRYPMHPAAIGLGCNMVIPASVFAHIGLFDERFGRGAPFPSGEEGDFFYRAHLQRVPITYVPNMTVYHCHGRKMYSALSDDVMATGALYAKHRMYNYFYWELRKAAHQIVEGGRPLWLLQVFKGMALFYTHQVRVRLYWPHN
jgi:GT2 family glycosyltransferase